MAKATKVNPHAGSSFDDYRKEDGIYEEVQARALKRALAEQLDEAMQRGKHSKVNMAQRMATSRSQLDRVLDPGNLSIQLDTLIKAASAVGRTVEIRLKRDIKRQRRRQSSRAGEGQRRIGFSNAPFSSPRYPEFGRTGVEHSA